MQNKNTLVRLAMLLALYLCGGQYKASAQQMENQWWQPNGAVSSIITDSLNNKVYIGGNFYYVGPPSSAHFALLDSANCIPNATIPSADGGVLDILPDGNGGQYICGDFNNAGNQSRSHLAHVMSNGQIGPLFSSLETDGAITKMAISGNTLYSIGNFTSLSYKQPYGNIVDVTNGGIINNSNKLNGQVTASAANGNSGWFIGGDFTAIGTARRFGLASINASGQPEPFMDSMRIGFYDFPASVPSIKALTVFNNQLYFGGSFNFIGRDQSFGGAVNTSGAYNAAFAGAPDGEVNVAIPDGSGGFYIGGSFSKIGGVSRPYLAQITASGQVTSWNPAVNGTVYCLFLSGTTLYAGGNFSSAGGQTRNYVAALNTANGNAYSWNPGANDIVYTITSGGSNIYLGGSFTKTAGQLRNRIAAVDATTGTLIAGFNPNADNTVRAIVYSAAQNQVYAAGRFTSIGGQNRNFLASLLPTDGTATSWDPNPSDAVYALLVQGSNLYAGGDFTYLYGPGVPKSLLASFALSTGNLNAGFDANLVNTGNPGIRSLAASGANIYAAGQFTSNSANYTVGAGSFNLTTGVQTSWRANCNSRINAISVAGTNVYLGGIYTIFAGSRRDNAASINLTNSQLTAWNPAPASGYVNAIAAPSPTSTNQTVLYIGGSYYGIGGNASRVNLAAVDLTNGTATAWAPQPNSEIKSLAVSGNSVIAAGTFNIIGANAISRNWLASLNATNGNAVAWNPNPDNVVYTLAISGTTMFVGGEFTSISSSPKTKLAAYSITNPAAPTLTAAFAPAIDAAVNGLAINGTTVYAGGNFYTVNTASRRGFAAFNAANGSLLSWDPSIDGTGYTASISSGQVFIGGNYTHVNNIGRNRAMAIDLTNGSLTAWNPAPDNMAHDIKVLGNQVFIGGDFSTIGGQSRSYLASVDATSGAASAWQPQPDGGVHSLGLQNDILYVGGLFNNIAGSARSNLAAFNNLTTTPALTPFLNTGGTDYMVYAIEPAGNLLYVGGSFTLLNGQPRNRIGCINLTTGVPTAWNPNADNEVYSLSATGNTVYAGGYFQNIGGGNRPYLAALNATTNTSNLNPWAPNPDVYIVKVLAYPGGVAAGGYFGNIGGMAAQNIVRLNVPSGKADPTWNLNLDGGVNAMALASNQGQLYIGGNFSLLNNVTARSGLASVSTSNATVSNWNPTNNGTVYALLYRQDTVYIGGSFTSINGVTRGRLAAIRASNNANTSGNPNLDGTVRDLASYNGFIFAAGEFTTSGAASRMGLAQFNAAGLGLTSWVNNLDYYGGYTLDIANNRLYVGGLFYNVNGVPRTMLAGINLLTNTLLDFNPVPNSYVYSVMPAEDGVYVGGIFNNIGGSARYGIAFLDTVTGYAKSWDANAGMTDNNYFNYNALARIGSRIFTGGNFRDLRGMQRDNFAVFVQPSTTPTPGPDVQYCYQSVFSQPYMATGTYGAGNIFTAELSDATGNFSNPIVLGSVASTTSGTIGCTLPASASPGTGYKIRVLSSDPIAIANTSQFTVTINPLPAAASAVVTPGGPLTFCQGQNVQLSVPSTAGNTYQWLNPTSQIAGATNNTYTATAAGDYAIRVTNNFGCSITSTPNVTVTVNPLPAATVTPNTTQTICASQTQTFQANTGSGLSYVWMKDGIPVSGATNSSYIANTGGTYSVKVTNASGCFSTSAGVLLNVNNCGPSIISLTPSSSFCQGGNVDIAFDAAGSYNAGNIFTAQLSNAAGSFTSPVTIGTLTSVSSGTINATLAATQAAGTGYRIRIISSNPSSTGANNGTNLTVIAQPTAAQVVITVTGSLTICQGGSVSFSVPSTAGLTYQWYLAGNPIAGATTNSYITTAAGVYFVTATNAAGCSRASSNKTVVVKQPPAATITPNTPQTICGAQTVTFQANTGSGLTYQWKNNNTNISGATTSSYIANASGSYSVTVTNSSGCEATSTAVAVTAGSCGASITDAGNRKVCQGGMVTVNFTAGGFSAGNVFTLQLSDVAGSFSSPQNIGTLSSAAGGTISGTIPAMTPPGNGYKLRLVSTNPVTTGQASSLTLNVQGLITDIVHLCAVSVDAATDKNELIWNKPVSTSIDSFIIYRNTTSAGIFEKIGAQAYGVLSKYTDNGSDPGKMAQRYYITGKNNCSETPADNIHRTMHLAINKGQNATTWNLIWNGYEGFTLVRYAIYRGTTPTSMTLLSEIEANTYNSFTDFSAPAGTVYYMVAVADGPSCNPTARTTGDFLIGSNIATNATQLPSANWMDMNIWPNPAQTSAQVLIQSSNPDARFTVKVLDVLGRNLEQFSALPDVPTDFGKMLSPGLYIIEAIGDNGAKISKRLVKR